MEYGFIILRHVKCQTTNTYWVNCYECIRKYYPENKIMIIDDNSDKKFLTSHKLHNTTVINSEYPGRGELLPYIYFLKNKLFDTAIIIHDSVFINRNIDFSVDKYKMLWEFEHDWDDIRNDTRLIKTLNDNELLDLYNNKHLWKGCFGGMTIICHEFLVFLNNKYNFSILLGHILTREDRMSFERIIGVILQKHHKTQSLLGNIHKYCPWGITIDLVYYFMHLPIIKVWTGR